MDCQTARQLMFEAEPDVGVAAHLEECAACRAEAALVRRVAGAVGAMPRVSAPEGLVARVMAEVRPQPDGVLSAPHPAPMALRPWEVGGLGALFLLLLALVPMALGRWLPSSIAVPSLSWGEWTIGVRRLASETWKRSLTGIGPTTSDWVAVWTGPWLVWLCGAAAFALALYLLLSWRPGGGPGREMEDAHA